MAVLAGKVAHTAATDAAPQVLVELSLSLDQSGTVEVTYTHTHTQDIQK